MRAVEHEGGHQACCGVRDIAMLGSIANLAYRFPIWPNQDRVHLQLSADYAWVDYVRGHRLSG